MVCRFETCFILIFFFKVYVERVETLLYYILNIEHIPEIVRDSD